MKSKTELRILEVPKADAEIHSFKTGWTGLAAMRYRLGTTRIFPVFFGLAMDDFDDQVNHVLAAAHAVEIWNSSEEVLVEALRRSTYARSRQSLIAWTRARLSHRPEFFDSLDLPVELKMIRPDWPRGCAFPLSGGDAGKIGFVSASAFANFPPVKPDSRSSSAAGKVGSPVAAAIAAGRSSALESRAEPIVKFFGSDLTAQVWTPEHADGDSVGLASLCAALVAVLEEEAPGLPPLRPVFALTGVVDSAHGMLSPVDDETLPSKLQAAARCGMQSLYVVKGQKGIPERPPLPVYEVPCDLLSTLSILLQALQNANAEIFQHFQAVEVIANKLNIPMGSCERFLPGVLAELATDPFELEEVRKELIPEQIQKHTVSSGIDGWQQLVDNYVKCKSREQSRGERLVHLCHVMLERHANDKERLQLARLTVHFNCSLKDALICEGAMSEIKELIRSKDHSHEFSEWLRLQMIAGSVQRLHRKEFVRTLIDSRDPRLVTLAIVAMDRLYRAESKSIDSVRNYLSRVMKSKRLPDHTPLKKERCRFTCRTDFRSMFSGRQPPRLGEVRSIEAAMCRFPVTNAEFECFDPSHERNRYSPNDDCPVVNVSWFEAFNFAFWAGLQLPTRVEWLSAAVPPGWSYPYQFDDFRKDKANYHKNGTNSVLRRQAHAKSHCGCVDMTGNVWEWVLEWCPARSAINPLDVGRQPLECRMTLGGGWRSELEELKLTSFAPFSPHSRQVDVGFRCLELLK